MITDIQDQVLKIANAIERTTPELYNRLRQRPATILYDRLERYLLAMEDAAIIHGENPEQLSAHEQQIADDLSDDLRRLAGFQDPEI